jgi:hypothetical protein
MRSLALAILAAVVVCGVTNAQTTDLRMGTWKLNLVKSKYTTGTPPKSQTLKFASSADGGFKFTVDTVPTDGQPTHTETVAKIDGKAYPVKGAQESALRLYTKTDDHTFTDVTKRNGKVAVTTKMVISPDGKTMTVTRNGVNGYGQKVNSVSVFDKQ